MNTHQKQPFFSIIIPTYARPKQLAVCLESLVRLDYPRARFEVIVVDDGSDKPPETVVAQFHDRLNVTLLTQPHAGPATARNTGATQAKGEILAFTDDDCTPASNWLQTLAAHFSETPAYAIGGQTLNTVVNNLYSTASQMLIDYLCAYYNPETDRVCFLTSNNLALPVNSFHTIGNFDTTFRCAGAEDRELCDRWLYYGYSMIYSSELLVHHTHALTFRTFWRQHFNYGCGAFYYHLVRAERRKERIRLEPISFYSNLVWFPFSLVRGWRAVQLAVLLAVSQVANAVGFRWEYMNRWRSRRQ